MRDPRALLSAQKLYGTRDSAESVCKQMVNIGRMIKTMKKEGIKNIHEVFYEELALNASYYGAQVYR